MTPWGRGAKTRGVLVAALDFETNSAWPGRAKMTTYTAVEPGEKLKARLNRADAGDCYIDENGDVVISDDSSITLEELGYLAEIDGQFVVVADCHGAWAVTL